MVQVKSQSWQGPERRQAIPVVSALDAAVNQRPDCQPVVADTSKLAVARIFVAEAGWSSEADHRAIFQVIRNIQGSGTLLQAARRASPRTTGTRPPINRRGCWVSTLLDSDTKPAGWGEKIHWQPYVQRWRSVRSLAARLVSGHPVQSPCKGEPVAWGGAMDDWLAIRRGLIRIDCGATLNRFWARR